MKIYYKILIFSCLISCLSKSENKSQTQKYLETTKDNTNIENPMNENNTELRHVTEQERKDFLTGKFQPNTHPNFVLVDKKLHTKSEMYLQKESLEAFSKMQKAAKSDGIELIIVSGTRNFYSQKSIWEKKYIKYKKEGLIDVEIIKKIMIWSAMPSTSRHHWGTDIDLNGFDDYFDGTNTKANKEYEWLVNNAFKFGFCQVYSEKGKGKRTTGYNEEKWHWSYMPLSYKYLKEYKELISYDDVDGFSASEHAKDLDIIDKYVYGISGKCNNH